MRGEQKEQWVQLCELAAVEQDSQKLSALVQEICRLLDEKTRRLSTKPNENV